MVDEVKMGKKTLSEIIDSRNRVNISNYIFDKSKKEVVSNDPLTIEFTRVIFMKNIEREVTRGLRKTEIYEIQNLLEALLVFFANIKDEKRTDAVIPSRTKIDEVFAPRGFYRSFSGSKLCGSTLDKAEKLIRKYLSMFLDNKSQFKIKNVNFDDGCFIVNNIKFQIQKERLNALIKTTSDPKVILMMILRYNSMLIQGQQWNIPRVIHELFLKEFEVQLEGFASPLNSQMLMLTKEAKFCSIFPDTDKVFGSQGDFFSLDSSYFVNKTSFVNPPFIFELMDKLGKRIYHHLSRVNSRFIVTVPERSSYYFEISNDYLEEKIVLEKGEYYFEIENDDRSIVKPFFSIVILIYSKGMKQKEYPMKEKVLAAMKTE